MGQSSSSSTSHGLNFFPFLPLPRLSLAADHPRHASYYPLPLPVYLWGEIWLFFIRIEAMTPTASVASHGEPKWEFSCDFEVDYESEKKASIVYKALVVDKELQPDKVKRAMSNSDGKLSIHFEAVEARFLRASFSAFVDVLTLATKTIEDFGQEEDF
uniref:Uncharacterized protein n=2 Tax=Cucumis sativus TaxID=3659 RepID=A0A0A0L7A2_CUCSA